MMTYTKNGLLITSMGWKEYQAKKKAAYEKWLAKYQQTIFTINEMYK